jgi:hypothetical protein
VKIQQRLLHGKDFVIAHEWERLKFIWVRGEKEELLKATDLSSMTPEA